MKALLWIAVLFLFFLASCSLVAYTGKFVHELRSLFPLSPNPQPLAPNPELPALYELTRDDFFAQKNALSTEVSIFGIRLGDTKERAKELLGEPDVKRSYGQTENWEYRERFGFSKIGLLLHFVEGKVSRITIKQPFNPLLHDTTKIQHRKEDLYRLFGRPSKIQLLSGYTIYAYQPRGIEIIMDGSRQNGFSLTLPFSIIASRREAISERAARVTEPRPSDSG